jgi:hypothetical protein
MFKMVFILFILVGSLNAQELKYFNKNKPIKASELNENFKLFNYFFTNGYNNQFQSGNIVSKDDINNLLGTLNNCNYSLLNGFFIKSEDFNNLFDSINCSFPELSFYNSTKNAFINIPYLKNDNLVWTIDGSLNTGIGYRKLDIFKPSEQTKNNKLIIYFHSLTKTKDLDSSFLLALKDNFVNKGFTFVSVEFRHPAVEGYSSLEDQFDIAKSIDFISKMSYFLDVNHNEINIIGYSKGTLSLANILDSRVQNYADFIKIKKIYLLDAQITYNEDKYYDLFIDKNQVNYGFFNVSAREAFGTLNDSSKAIAGIELLNDSSAVDSYLSVINSTNMQGKSNLPKLRLGYNYQAKGLIKVNDVLTSLIPIQINATEFDYLLHNPESINILCNEYNKYGICSGIDNLSFNGTTIINDIDAFILSN